MKNLEDLLDEKSSKELYDRYKYAGQFNKPILNFDVYRKTFKEDITLVCTTPINYTKIHERYRGNGSATSGGSLDFSGYRFVHEKSLGYIPLNNGYDRLDKSINQVENYKVINEIVPMQKALLITDFLNMLSAPVKDIKFVLSKRIVYERKTRVGDIFFTNEDKQSKDNERKVFGLDQTIKKYGEELEAARLQLSNDDKKELALELKKVWDNLKLREKKLGIDPTMYMYKENFIGKIINKLDSSLKIPIYKDSSLTTDKLKKKTNTKGYKPTTKPNKNTTYLSPSKQTNESRNNSDNKSNLNKTKKSINWLEALCCGKNSKDNTLTM